MSSAPLAPLRPPDLRIVVRLLHAEKRKVAVLFIFISDRGKAVQGAKIRLLLFCNYYPVGLGSERGVSCSFNGSRLALIVLC